jgi:hypothetical protein
MSCNCATSTTQPTPDYAITDDGKETRLLPLHADPLQLNYKDTATVPPTPTPTSTSPSAAASPLPLTAATAGAAAFGAAAVEAVVSGGGVVSSSSIQARGILASTMTSQMASVCVVIVKVVVGLCVS